MKLVKFTNINGDQIAVNPEQVLCVRLTMTENEHGEYDKVTHILGYMNGFYVKEDFETAVSMLNEGGNIK